MAPVVNEYMILQHDMMICREIFDSVLQDPEGGGYFKVFVVCVRRVEDCLEIVNLFDLVSETIERRNN